MAPRKNPIMRVGNYAAPVDTSGMDADMKEYTEEPLGKLSDVESSYLNGAQNKDTAKQAIRKARKANKGL